MADVEMITILSAEGEKIETPANLWELSELVAGMDKDEEINLPTVKATNIKTIEEFLKMNAEEPPCDMKPPLKSNDLRDNGMQEQYCKLLEKFEYNDFCDFLNAAQYLQIKPLIGLCMPFLASIWKGKSMREMMTLHGFPEDHPEPTKDELEKIKEKYNISKHDPELKKIAEQLVDYEINRR